MKILSLIVCLLVSSAAALAQPFPSKPVRWIVPTGPGSAVDVIGRRVAPKLSESLGQPVIVENRPGANSMIGAREVARSAPDGYTLLQGVINNALNDLVAPDVIRDHVRAGKLRGLATSGRERASILPDVPTMAEAGYPGVEGTGWNGVFVPAGTPAPVVQRLQQEIAKALAAKDIRDDA